ncbi:hypothetical protein Tco_0294782 [Tanacetum coccineum]
MENLTMEEYMKKFRDEYIENEKIYAEAFDEYLAIKRDRDVYERNRDIEDDLSNKVFVEWLALKFCSHLDMDWYTKNTPWVYWVRGDDEEVLTDDEDSIPKEHDNDNEAEIDEIFGIDTDLFHYITPLCKAFNEFNYLLNIDIDLFTYDISRFEEKPWSDNGIGQDDTLYICQPFCFSNGTTKRPTYNSDSDGYCNGGELPGMLDPFLFVKLSDYWWKKNDHENVSFSDWRDHVPKKTYANAYPKGYNPWRNWDINKATSEDHGHEPQINADNTRCMEEPYDDNNGGNMDDNPILNNLPNQEDNEEHNNDERGNLFDLNQGRPPMCNVRRFEIIKYSFGPAEVFMGIKEREYDDETRTEEDARQACQDIFRKINEGWTFLENTNGKLVVKFEKKRWKWSNSLES